jgi:hypothetical protein
MSRSKKKVFGFVDRNPFMKNLANRRVRRTSVETDIASGKAYKKLTEQYDICDWRFIYYTEVSFKSWVKFLYTQYPDESNGSFESHYAKEKAYNLSK